MQIARITSSRPRTPPEAATSFKLMEHVVCPFSAGVSEIQPLDFTGLAKIVVIVNLIEDPALRADQVNNCLMISQVVAQFLYLCRSESVLVLFCQVGCPSHEPGMYSKPMCVSRHRRTAPLGRNFSSIIDRFFPLLEELPYILGGPPTLYEYIELLDQPL